MRTRFFCPQRQARAVPILLLPAPAPRAAPVAPSAPPPSHTWVWEDGCKDAWPGLCPELQQDSMCLLGSPSPLDPGTPPHLWRPQVHLRLFMASWEGTEVANILQLPLALLIFCILCLHHQQQIVYDVFFVRIHWLSRVATGVTEKLVNTCRFETPFLFSFLSFLEPHPQHMEGPRLGV